MNCFPHCVNICSPHSQGALCVWLDMLACVCVCVCVCVSIILSSHCVCLCPLFSSLTSLAPILLPASYLPSPSCACVSVCVCLCVSVSVSVCVCVCLNDKGHETCFNCSSTVAYCSIHALL